MKLNKNKGASYGWLFCLMFASAIVFGVTFYYFECQILLLLMFLMMPLCVGGALYIEVKTQRLLNHRWVLNEHYDDGPVKYKINIMLQIFVLCWCSMPILDLLGVV